MEKILQIASWLAVGFGGLAIYGSFDMYGADGSNAFLGGAMFIGLGALAIKYINEKIKEVAELNKQINDLKERLK